jgi:hypothetical protein
MWQCLGGRGSVSIASAEMTSPATSKLQPGSAFVQIV